MFSDESLITIIRQLTSHNDLKQNEIISVFVNAIDKTVTTREISPSDIYEMVIDMLITGEWYECTTRIQLI